MLRVSKDIPEGLISLMREEQLARDTGVEISYCWSGLYPVGLASPTDGDLGL